MRQLVGMLFSAIAIAIVFPLSYNDNTEMLNPALHGTGAFLGLMVGLAAAFFDKWLNPIVTGAIAGFLTTTYLLFSFASTVSFVKPDTIDGHAVLVEFIGNIGIGALAGCVYLIGTLLYAACKAMLAD